MPTTKELKSITITNQDLDKVKTTVLKELKNEHTKCVESYVDGVSDYISAFRSIIMDGK